MSQPLDFPTIAAGQNHDRLGARDRVDSRYYLALVGGVGWLIGVWLASHITLPPFFWLAMGTVAVMGAIAFWQNGRTGLILAGCAAAALGGGRFVLAQPASDTGHVHAFNGSRNVLIVGQIVDEPIQRDRFVQLRLAVSELVLDGRSVAAAGEILVQTWRFPILPYGATVRLYGNLEPPEALGSPGYASYLRRQGIQSIMAYPQVDVLSLHGGSPFYRALLAIREHGRSVIRRTLPEPQTSLLTGILLGDDSGMPREWEEAFRTTGMTHIIAISGFNIALLIALLDRLSGLFLPRRTAALIIMVLVAFYAALVGGAASVVRAAVMGIVYLAATRLLGRPTLAVSALLVASFFMTLWNPRVLWDVGFQLSFAATLGLMLYAGKWTAWSERRLMAGSNSPARRRAVRLLGEVLVVTLAAQILTLPLILYHFGRLSLISLPANILILPAQPAVMFTGGLTLLAGSISPLLGQIAGWGAWLFLSYTTAIVGLLAEVPGASVPLEMSALTMIIIYAAIGAVTVLAVTNRQQQAIRQERIRTKWVPAVSVGVGVILLVFVMVGISQRPDGRLHVVFLDVGQGDAIFLQTPDGRQVLVDGGRYPSQLLDLMSRQMPFWDRSLDIVIATHPDEDHIAGLVTVLERYQTDRLITNGVESTGIPIYEALLTAAAGQKTPVHVTRAGETVDLGGGVSLEILHPDRSFRRDSQNEASVVARLTYGELAVLLTGDAEAAAEKAMLDGGHVLEAIVLKAGHHGANASSSESFLAAVRPRYIIISAGRDNSYGHPHPAMLSRAGEIGAVVMRTDELGTIELISDGLKMWWQSDN
ncbi:MAG: DNA internalization-related competence protein ComEC/Rec2 [Chloroflexota bacterium]